ncbi:MAG: glycosyltransferase [Patescibacteria group bacterium]|nr:glycosyltransferase [Patescibacteria group bacterium]
MNKKNLLVTLADKKYLDFAKQLFSSVYFNSGWQGDYMLLAHEVPEEDLKWFRDKGILIKKCEPLAEKLVGRWPAVILSKLYLFTSEFKQWDKIIFLDADLIVTASLDNLLDTNKIAATGIRYFFWQVKLKHFLRFYELNNKFQQTNLKKYNLNLPIPCCNFLVINTEIITHKTFDDLKSLLIKYQNHIGNIDEFILSLYFANEWDNLSPIYCLNYNQLKNYYIEPKKLKSIMVHFISYQKPIYYCQSIYNTWKDNLSKADQINLNNRPSAQFVWSDEELKKYHHHLIRQIIFSCPKWLIDRFIGWWGLALKKLSPDLYYFLLKFKQPASMWINSKILIDRLLGLVGIFLKKYSPWLYKKLKQLPFATKKMADNQQQLEKLLYKIRPYQAGDEAGLINIINKIFDPTDYAKWIWKYKNCPMGSMILVAENSTKEIIGQFAVLRHKIKYYSKEQIIHQIAEVGIEKQYRDQGFIKSCFSMLIDQGNFLPWGFVNKKMNSVYGRVVPAAGAHQANKTIKSNLLEKRLYWLCWPKILNFNEKIIQSELTIEKVSADEGEKEINSLWERKKTEINVGVVRNWEFIKWRIIDSPKKMDLFIVKKSSKIIGYFSLEKNETNAVISDILILNEYINASIFLAIEYFCQKLGVRKLRLVTTDMRLLKILHLRNYYKGREIYFTYNDSCYPIETDDLYLTCIDADWSLLI